MEIQEEPILFSHQGFLTCKHYLEAYHEHNTGQYTWGQVCHSGSTSFSHPPRGLYLNFEPKTHTGLSVMGTLFTNSNILWSIVPSNNSSERLGCIGCLASRPYTRKNGDILVVEFWAV
ncbi:9653_t:CDS:2 [Gigaspora rosea]|nr:9653_t:CDS:2 [Gigaspora rosea]